MKQSEQSLAAFSSFIILPSAFEKTTIGKK
jgi:hypothetical protein